MLRELRIQNFAIIDAMELSFAGGMNVLTGETGAGKSIITRAISLLCGGRASSELVRSDCDEAEIEGLFELAEADRSILADHGLEAADELLVRRVIQRSGKGRVYLNGTLGSAGLLAQLGQHLIHVYGQHEHALLLKPETHLSFVDEFGKFSELKARMSTAYAAYREAAERLAQMTTSRATLQQRLELLRFQVDELTKARVERGEETALKQERERQRHAERLQQTCQSCETALYSGDEAISTVLGRLVHQVSDAARLDPAFESSLETLRQAVAQVDDAALELRRLGERIERDPERLEQIEERLALLARLKRKYECEADELVDQLERRVAELDPLEGGGIDLEELKQRVCERAAAAWQVAVELSRARQQTAGELERQMVGELASLGMDGVQFRVVFDRRAGDEVDERQLTPEGVDVLELYLSANPGEEPRPLARVASGGELSRIMLALKALTAGAGEVDTLIFDEVDTGIGGTVAESVGRRLHRLAAGRQVLSITHLPQIAALADHHLAVQKQTRKGRTHSTARQLEGEERVQEIARMLGAAGSQESELYARRLIAGR